MQLQPANRGLMAARAQVPEDTETNVCIVSPEARYRGAENQLYRVEIHRGGESWDGQSAVKDKAATFKWSRDAVAFPIQSLSGQTVLHYRILQKIGAGGSGIVYQAEDTRLSRNVALKFLKGETSDPEAFERFQRTLGVFG